MFISTLLFLISASFCSSSIASTFLATDLTSSAIFKFPSTFLVLSDFSYLLIFLLFLFSGCESLSPFPLFNVFFSLLLKLFSFFNVLVSSLTLVVFFVFLSSNFLAFSITFLAFSSLRDFFVLGTNFPCL